MDQFIVWLKESVTPQNIVFALAWMVVGTILSWPITKGLEYLRTPKIEFTPDERNPTPVIFKREMVINDRGTKNYVLRLIVKNVRWEDGMLGKIVPERRWSRTRKAEQCCFDVCFFDQAGNSVCQEPMLARITVPDDVVWSVYKLPLAYHHVDIHPNQAFYVDLVIKLEGSNECYGLWHQTGYSCIESVTDPNVLISRNEANWRKTDEIWRLESGIYKIMIKTYSDGQILKRDYLQLINLHDQFRVEKTSRFKYTNCNGLGTKDGDIRA
jgi:hypothetical protein